MEIVTLNLLDILHKSQALYSTNYSGEFRTPVDFLDLILENSDTRDSIVFGLMFLQKKGDKSYLVVDGMKRLITLSLFLHAICECYKLTNEKNIHAIKLIKSRYLFNEEETKIQLNGFAKQVYEKLVKYEKMTPEEKAHPMFEMLHDFWVKIKMNNISAVQLFNELKKMKVLCCIYEDCDVENRDLYQLLNAYQSIDEIALITDFVKDYAPEDEQYWFDIMKLYKDIDLSECFEDFIRNFLTIQKNGIIPQSNLYRSFKRFYQRMNVYQQPKEIFKTIEKFAKHYIQIIQADFENFEIKKLVTTINEQNMHETYPYLLEVLDDYKAGRLTEETLIELLTTVIKFIEEQRQGHFTSTIDFANLSHEINQRLD